MRHSLPTTGLLVGLVIGFAFELSAGPADSQQLTAEIRVLTGQPVGRIDPDVYGLFTEMCYYEFNGGMWAEMLKARKFAEDDGDGERYGVVRPWFPLGKNDHVHFLHDNTVYYCGRQSQKIVSQDTGNRRTGIGQRDLYFQAKREYRVRLNLKQESVSGPVTVALEGEGGIYAERQVAVSGPDWIRFSFVLTATHTDKNGCLTVTFPGKGTLWVGSASLMSVDNMGGFRTDVVQALKALHIPNVRWPGGNMVSEYQWTDGIGDRDKRPPRFIRELWEPNDVGIDEFMELCRLIDTKPYVAVNAGNGTAEQAAAEVEYCNGGPGTKYGKERARNGHPELMKALDDMALTENTILVFTSDHGDMLYSLGLTYKQWPYEECVRVPLLVRYPRRAAARKVDSLISSVDILPTMLSLCGAPIPDGVQGTDFAETVRGGEGPSPDSALIMCVQPCSRYHDREGTPAWRGLRTRTHTYARFRNEEWCLYDNEKDPYQRRNLFVDRYDEPGVKALREKLDGSLQARLKAIDDGFDASPFPKIRWS